MIKIGTHVLSKKGRVDTEFLQVIAAQISELVKKKRQVILVTSGALGMGAGALGIKTKISDVKKRQACAAIGQGILMHEYRMAFNTHDQEVAQVLLTNKILSHRKYYVNIKNTMETLLSMGIVPIVNENDCVSIDEIGLAFGDNDRLSALVASKIDAELLIMLTDVNGLYDKNPKNNTQARLIPIVYEITNKIEAMATKAGSTFATGGMRSKIDAIRISANGGCTAVLAHGRKDNALLDIIAGKDIGTLFLPKRRLSNRKRWILNCHTEAQIEIDPGAATALKNHRSLLLVGITQFTGQFKSGDVVKIGTVAKGVCNLSSAQLHILLQENAPVRKAIIHANDMVLLEE